MIDPTWAKKLKYLGDGLYAHDDRFMLTLVCDRENGQNWVGLEPEVLVAALQLVANTRKLKITIENQDGVKQEISHD